MVIQWKGFSPPPTTVFHLLPGVDWDQGGSALAPSGNRILLWYCRKHVSWGVAARFIGRVLLALYFSPTAATPRPAWMLWRENLLPPTPLTFVKLWLYLLGFGKGKLSFRLDSSLCHGHFGFCYACLIVLLPHLASTVHEPSKDISPLLFITTLPLLPTNSVIEANGPVDPGEIVKLVVLAWLGIKSLWQRMWLSPGKSVKL